MCSFCLYYDPHAIQLSSFSAIMVAIAYSAVHKSTTGLSGLSTLCNQFCLAIDLPKIMPISI